MVGGLVGGNVVVGNVVGGLVGGNMVGGTVVGGLVGGDVVGGGIRVSSLRPEVRNSPEARSPPASVLRGWTARHHGWRAPPETIFFGARPLSTMQPLPKWPKNQALEGLEFGPNGAGVLFWLPSTSMSRNRGYPMGRFSFLWRL